MGTSFDFADKSGPFWTQGATQSLSEDGRLHRCQAARASFARSTVRVTSRSAATPKRYSHFPKTLIFAQVQMVGTYARKSGTFQWSWHTYGDRCDPLVGGLSDLEGFGEVRGIERLRKVWWECEPNEGWEMTALAGYLSGCDAAYRAPFEDVDRFMPLTNMRSVD